ncbi:MAG: carboxypeptidase regulatory-like domain-containing protein [Planctomycetes bacterium]|nr:carboxypeptidase regulatory-like domain-containing protein [Planctomycetota bacterium]
MRNKSLILVIFLVFIAMIVSLFLLFQDFTNTEYSESRKKTVDTDAKAKIFEHDDNKLVVNAEQKNTQTDNSTDAAEVIEKTEIKPDEKEDENPNLTGLGRIEGIVVYRDADDDGVSYGNKKPAVNAQVRLLDTINKNMGLAKELATTTTDEKGFFEFTKIPKGQYLLQIEKEGFAIKQVGSYRIKIAEIYHIEIELKKGMEVWGVVTNENEEKIADAFVLAIKIMPEQVFYQPVTTNEAGEYKIKGLSKGRYFFEVQHGDYANLKEMAEVSGSQQKNFVLKIGGGIRGIVTNSEGLPVDNFRVKAYEYGDPMTSFSSKLSTMSVNIKNPEGRYEISSLKPGDYTLEVYSAKYARALVSKIVVEKGKYTDVNVKLEEGATLHGKVLEKDTENPVPGARVSLATYVQVKMGRGEFEMKDPSMANDSAEFATLTDEEGNFEITGLPRKKREVRVSHSDYPKIKEEIDFVATKDVEKVSYLETQSARIYGHVKDARGEACAGYTVQLSTDMNIMSQSQHSAITNDEGYYAIENVKPGNYVIIVQQKRFSFLEISSISLKSGDDLEVNFGIDGGVIVTGDVTLKDKKLKDAMVIFTPKDPKGQIRTGSANENGHYEIGGITPGKYSVLVISSAGFGMPTSTKLQTDVPDVKEHIFNIEFPLSTLKGKIFDEETREPLSRVQIFLEDVESNRDAQNFTEVLAMFSGSGNTNSKGEFEIKNLAPVKYHIRISRNGYSTEIIENFEMKADFDAVLSDVFLKKQLQATGFVKDEAGNAIAGAQLSVKDSKGRSVTLIFGPTTDKDGKFTLEGLSEGRYSVTAVAPGFQKKTKYINISLEQPSEILITLAGGCTLNIEVTDLECNGVSNALVEIKDSRGNVVKPNFYLSRLNSEFSGNLNPYLTNASGRASRESLIPGTYTLIVTKTGYLKFETKVMVSKNYPTDFKATMTPE